MSKSFCVLLSLFFVSPLVTAEIFKCTRESGNIIYQNFPCNVDSIGSHATATAPPEQASAAPTAPVPVKSKAQVADADKALGTGLEPRVGMTKGQVKASTWGDPIDIVKEEVVEGNVETWHYDYANKRTVVFGTNKRVSDVTQ